MQRASSTFFRGASARFRSGLFVFLAATSLAPASGTRVGFKDAFATARGNAFVATADNPSALYYNPAGLAQLDGTQVSANLYSVSAKSDYSGIGGTASMDDGAQNIPAFYVSWKPQGAPWTYGLGIYVPFGLATDWPASSPLRTFALKNKQTYRTYNFSARLAGLAGIFPRRQLHLQQGRH